MSKCAHSFTHQSHTYLPVCFRVFLKKKKLDRRIEIRRDVLLPIRKRKEKTAKNACTMEPPRRDGRERTIAAGVFTREIQFRDRSNFRFYRGA